MALPNFGRGKYLKNTSLFDFEELQLKNVILIILNNTPCDNL